MKSTECSTLHFNAFAFIVITGDYFPASSRQLKKVYFYCVESGWFVLMINNLPFVQGEDEENPFQQLSSENKHLLRFMSSKPRPNDEIWPFCVAPGWKPKRFLVNYRSRDINAQKKTNA